MVDTNKSLTSTSSTLAISTKVSIDGCETFVHHFETVAGSFCKIKPGSDTNVCGKRIFTAGNFKRYADKIRNKNKG